MKKYYYSLIVIFMMSILPAFSFASENEKGMDMDAYSTWAGYGFLAMLTIFFAFFLYYSSNETVKIYSEKPVLGDTISNALRSEILAPLNLISYSIIAVLILYTIVFALLIF